MDGTDGGSGFAGTVSGDVDCSGIPSGISRK